MTLDVIKAKRSQKPEVRAAARTSGFWLRFALMTSRVIPTTALFVVLLTLRVCGHRCQSAGQPRAADGPSRGSATAKGTPRERRGRGAKRAATTALQQVRPPARPGPSRAAVCALPPARSRHLPLCEAIPGPISLAQTFRCLIVNF